MGDEPYEEADEGAKVYGDFFEYREHALKIVTGCYEKQKGMDRAFREDVEILQDELKQDGLTDSEKQDLENQLGAAIKAFNTYSAKVEHGSVYNKIILGEQMDEVCERQSDTFDDMKAANLDMSGALDEMAKKIPMMKTIPSYQLPSLYRISRLYEQIPDF
ncbi:hypothetical protein BASA60_000126 [Batrachochytrium salamandrivorans]|nr:hypothetical protein BASA60_000126 [Batrachochytrium salamandrivorans]